MKFIGRKFATWSVTAALGVSAAGCATNTGNGALIGGAAGAGLGAIAGSASRHGSTAGGALLGGVIGAAAGAIIGNAADREEDRRDGRYYYYDRPVYRYRVYRADPYGYPPPPPPPPVVPPSSGPPAPPPPDYYDR